MTEQIPVTTGQQLGRRSWAEPWKIKMVEPLWIRLFLDATRMVENACDLPRRAALLPAPRAGHLPRPRYLRFFHARFEPL